MQVSNSTGEDGLAATAASELQQHGFNVTDPDDYPGPLDSTTVFFSAGQRAGRRDRGLGVSPTPTIERVTGMGDDVQVVLGSDFNAVSAPSPSGSPGPGPRRSQGTSSAPTHLPEDLTVTNAADTTCE